MKIKVNRNILWTESFVNKLVSMGVRYACISPGSRSAPLTIAFANNENIKSFVMIDERSSAFFALGLAQSSSFPVALVCTSGTAAAEFYPAIIEAFQQRIPLIICTADRPPELIGRGANQAIYQDNIYQNHIRYFINAGLPVATREGLMSVSDIARAAFLQSMIINRGPVHINFPFAKPLEPSAFTDEVDESLISVSHEWITNVNPLTRNLIQAENAGELLDETAGLLKTRKRGLLIAGPGNFGDSFAELCYRLSLILNYPVIADAASQLRFGGADKSNVIADFEGFIRSDKFFQSAEPELIIQFGRAPTSKGMELFIEKTSADYYAVDEYGDWHDPFHKAKAVVILKPEIFCFEIIKRLEKDNFIQPDGSYSGLFKNAERISLALKSGLIEKASFLFEGRVITEVIELIPDSSVIMISNSMPARDLDYFAPKSNKDIKIFHNRGASGIDGITSTALGIAIDSGRPAVLITGDLSFYYDLNGLLASMKYSIPLVIVLINNNGGGIFEMLPISGYEKVFNDYFTVPHNLDFAPIVKAYGGGFINIESFEHFRESFRKALSCRSFTVLQIKTSAKQSAAYRKEFWVKVAENI
ncbi:MAG: 2-succinyl-5-enolpyruvyl-6-hydroxy-3-cyclohexene-1-carboxylic-acid synthase [Ignavibacteria bacterium]